MVAMMNPGTRTKVDRMAAATLPVMVTAIVVAIATASVFAGPALAGAPALYPAIHIISADEVLRDHTEAGADGSLYFIDQMGARWPLATSTTDPAIANPGDGSFHPVEEAPILSLLETIPSVFLAPLAIEIYILPYPRAGSLSSSADSRAIYLSPGTYPYAPEQIASLVSHELGHAVQRALLPDSDLPGWAAYAALRGIEDDTVFRADARHADRPHEIFAEDFRVLFGGELAAGDGSVENHVVDPPNTVRGLAAFIYGLTGGRPAPSPPAPQTEVLAANWTVSPNPSRVGQPVILRPPVVTNLGSGRDRVGTGSLTVFVYDASGREVGRQEVSALDGPIPVPSRDLPGPGLAAGAYWVRLVSSAQPGRPVTVPLRRTR
jgi:hypothetical protein